MSNLKEILCKHEETYLYESVYGAIYCIDDVLLAKYKSEILKRKDYFLECLDELRNHFDSPNYTASVRKGIEYYHTNNPNFEVNIMELHLSCINDPLLFDAEKFYKTYLDGLIE